MIKLNVDILGQVFTQSFIVTQMLNLRKNKGSILEPSCGDGAFFNRILNCIGIEYDNKVCPAKALNMNFFTYDIKNKFDTIIGNPPYVKYQNILDDTKNILDKNLLNERANLYLFFIEKCIKHLNPHGELIFIVPRDFIKATASIKLNQYLYSAGTITDWIEIGDEIVFPGFNPNCVIFRFEKSNFSRKTNQDLNFVENKGQLLFLKNTNSHYFSDYFFVKVGAASGADNIFEHKNGNQDFVCSKTAQTGKTKKMFYNIEHKHLKIHKKFLINRKIKKFNEKNWYTWGRVYFNSELPRIYVNGKTRNKKPFFLSECNAYDGSILAIFPKFVIRDKEHLQEVCDYLNSVDWNHCGFKCGQRFLFNQKSLENTLVFQTPPQ